MRTVLLSDHPNPITAAARRFPEAIIFATPIRKAAYPELLLAAWHIDRSTPEACSLWMVRDDRDMTLFMIANGVSKYERINIV